ncbi:MAG: hypothetical protein KBA14_03010, partial [Saprospiraceae bacterium]|nr:hypothetical protein [Saprospiraceae bacterium]
MKVCNNELINTRPSGRVFWMVLTILALGLGNVRAQQETVVEEVAEEEMIEEIKPVKNTFESIYLIDAQTVMVPVKGTFEADFQHRFGTWNNGYDDFYGVFASSNIRLGVDYVPIDRLQVGLGFTKFYNLIDVYGKYALLRQMKGGGSAISLDYYVNAAVDTRREDANINFEEGTDRWSFFHQIMIARKITDKFSLQVSGNLSWFNNKDVYDTSGEFVGKDQNGHFSATALARYKLSNTLGVIVEYDQPITSSDELVDPQPNLSFGLEVVTSSHAF